MRSRLLLLSTLLHGAAITGAVVAVQAGGQPHREPPVLGWAQSQDRLPPAPPERPPPPPAPVPEPSQRPEPAPAPAEPFDPRAFAPSPPNAEPRTPRPPLLPERPDVRIRRSEPVQEPAAAEEAEHEVPTPEPPAAEAAYVPARVRESDNDPPRYPRRARQLGQEGEVLVRVRVGADGRPEEVTLARACRYPALNREAVRAVRNWRFEPARRGGRPEPAVILVPVEFRLR